MLQSMTWYLSNIFIQYISVCILSVVSFVTPLIILQLECASQKKPRYGITDSMRTTAVPPTFQSSPPPVRPVYAYQSSTPMQNTKTPVQSQQRSVQNPEAPVQSPETPVQNREIPANDTPGDTAPSGDAKVEDRKDDPRETKETVVPPTNGEKDAGGFDECPELTPECLKNIVN